MSRTLVAYFSASGVTARLAETIAKAAGADLYEIVPKVPYTAADLNWNNSSSRSSVEMNDKASRPEIAEEVENMGQYDTVFVGFPIWWYEAPRIIHTFLESYDFSGKTVIPFATSGGSGMGKTSDILQKTCPAAKVLPGKRLSVTASEAQIKSWMGELGL
ncbi:MAG TPA: NAD(P)H-dependent oxidoreductase [Candidatus Mediterraneibacter pullicola]|uniref:NAD(P)H-dependent oxidoreductase n=1 Tax=Candidatus Mediterraneibacter pullicola TaxID=2838682 RepID=A0A9D2KJB7_9FIRM|nr:NAD(P)H-dependent oxidoreductase [Candidatus Mediterraneibacter pullicola]